MTHRVSQPLECLFERIDVKARWENCYSIRVDGPIRFNDGSMIVKAPSNLMRRFLYPIKKIIQSIEMSRQEFSWLLSNALKWNLLWWTFFPKCWQRNEICLLSPRLYVQRHSLLPQKAKHFWELTYRASQCRVRGLLVEGAYMFFGFATLEGINYEAINLRER